MPLISSEDLVANKLLAGRAQDVQDLAEILRQTAVFNVGRCRDVLARIEQALDRPDLSRDFESDADKSEIRSVGRFRVDGCSGRKRRECTETDGHRRVEERFGQSDCSLNQKPDKFKFINALRWR